MLAMLAAGILCGCSKEDQASAGNDNAILLAPFVDGDMAPAKASLYRNSIDLRSDLIHTYVYHNGTDDPYFDSDVKYSTEDIDASKHQWLFCGTDGTYKKYYWPLATALDFFAYAPSSTEYVTVDHSTNPPTFTADMPLTNTGEGNHQDKIKEFMYAYTPSRTVAGGTVPLEFQHPFAAVRFVVSQSHRDLTVNSISICGIDCKGTFNPEDETWTGLSADDMVLKVGKKIPEQVNFGGELCGPYLFLPQENAGKGTKSIEIEVEWEGNMEDDKWVKVDGKDNTFKNRNVVRIPNDWEASKVYTYTLDLGNSREEILFKVSIEEWDFIYEHEFEIE